MDAASYLGGDRLSELPDSLILEILSLLEMKYVVRTTVLSKRWKDLWTDITCLHFGHSSQTFVEGALAKWKGAKILKFDLGFSLDNDFIDSCLLLSLEKHVEELYVFFQPFARVELLATQRLFTCSSITKLALYYCDLEIGENVNLQWDHLKSLRIGLPINLSVDSMSQILCGAPLLEELILVALNITGKLYIVSSGLKMLRIDGDIYSCEDTKLMAEGMLIIWAPNLLTLDFSAWVYGTCFLDVPSLTDAMICFEEDYDDYGYRIYEDFAPLAMFAQFFQSLRHVEKLTLSALCIEFLLNMKESNMLVLSFSNTKYLKLSANKAEGMLDVLGMFPVLKNLVAELSEDDYYSSDDDACNSSASEMTFPNPSLLQLKTVEIKYYFYDASIIRMVEILLENAHVLEKLVLLLFAIRADEETFMLAKKKVLSLPRSSPTAQVIISK